MYFSGTFVRSVFPGTVLVRTLEKIRNYQRSFKHVLYFFNSSPDVCILEIVKECSVTVYKVGFNVCQVFDPVEC